MKLRSGLPRLRNSGEYAALRAAFTAACDRNGFRLTHYAVLNDHLRGAAARCSPTATTTAS